MMKEFLATSLVSLCLFVGDANAQSLISLEEAALPEYAGDREPRLRSALGGPRIEILAPDMKASDKPSINKPVVINVKFEALDGANVAMDSLRVIYLRLFGIDITDRLRPYVKGSAIAVDEADIPVGDHSIRVEIKDNLGRKSSETFNFIVLP
jgi:hypothetical protein